MNIFFYAILRSSTRWLTVATIFLATSVARGQVNHGGADWITGTETVSGHHYNIGRFVVPGGTTLTVQSSLVVDCVSAIVDGVIDGNYRGNAGIGGGGGGGGGADQNKPGKGGAATPNAGSGVSGAGQEGGTVRGGNGGNGVGGASGGPGSATSNGAKGDDGANAVGALSVGDGVNLGLLWAFDDPGSYEGLIGGGGRGGGGGGGGDSDNTNSGGGGGGAGGGGGPGGAMVQIRALLDVHVGGVISTVGGRGSPGGGGGNGKGYDRAGASTPAGDGGAGGYILVGTGIGGPGGTGGTDTYGDKKGQKAGNGGPGGAGGSGAGGSVRIRGLRSVRITGTINAQSAAPAQPYNGVIFVEGYNSETPGPLLGRVIVRTGGEVGQPYNPPVISPASGIYSNPIQVTISAEPGAKIRYTTNGQDPSQGFGAEVLGSATFSISNPQRVRAWAYGSRPPSPVSEQSYDFRPVPPIFVFDPPVIGTGPVTLSNVTASIIRGAGDNTSSLSYSTNNGVSWVAYTGPLRFGRNFAIQAKAEVAGWRPSDSNPSGSIEFKVAPVQLNPPDGKSGVNPFEVAVTTTNPVPTEIWYSINGQDPTPNGAGAVKVVGNKITVVQSGIYKFAAFTPGWTQSEVKSATYSIVTGDLVFSPWALTNAFVSDKPIEITISSPSTNPDLRIRVGWTEASVSATNPSPIIITNGGKVRVTRSPSTLYAQAFGPGITAGTIRQGLYAVRRPDVEVGDLLPTPDWAATNALPVLPEKQFNIQQVENGGITNRITNSWQYFTLVSLGRNGTNAVQAPYAVVRSPLQTVEWKYPTWETNIQVLQTITSRKNQESVVTLYHTENMAPTISQNLMVSLPCIHKLAVRISSRGGNRLCF